MSDTRVIHKTALLPGVTNVPMNVGAKIVHVAAQHGDPTIWFEVDPDAPFTTRHFHVIGTGYRYTAGLTHLGTAMVGPLVLHVFEAP